MAKKIGYLILTFLLSGCAGSPLGEAGDGLEIGRIRIDKASKHLDGSTEMITRCNGFVLAEKEVHDFLAHASRIKDEGTDKYYRILPCSATGTAVINKRKYSWVIRAGGIGEFSSGAGRFIAICGKRCCEKVPGVC